jgi:AcrR family transcriptional regulator
MSELDKPRRPYRSQRRQEGAQETRARILDAAQRLLVARGYAGATVAAIAEDAGTAPETVYQAFGNKRTLLAELVRRAVRGDDPAPVLEQAGPREVNESNDPAEQLRLFALDIAKRLERVGPLMGVLADAARSDPELAATYGQFQKARRRNLSVFVDALAANAPLRTTPDEATDTVWTLASPELYTLQTQVAGWSRKRYAAWLAESLAALLLDQPNG